MLRGKKILIGVTGSIAAYKIATLVRLLIKESAEVKVVMTDDAKEFITPLTLSTLSKNPVYSDFYKNDGTGEWNNHVELALWADLMVIAPATANTLAKIASGLCDNLLLATYLSAKCPVFISPAMDLDMFKHTATKNNIDRIKSYGNTIINPNHGELASGLVGEGRMAEPEEILEELKSFFLKDLPLKNRKALITAGPTYEKIDPVRFIGNHSSGKMGVAIAKELASQGAEIELVLGPSTLEVDYPGVKVTRVTSSDEMYRQSMDKFESSDIAILSAAVADYRPKNPVDDKIKKELKKEVPAIELEKTVDILASLGKKKKEQLLVGFALETSNEMENAKSKLERKNLDFIVLNSLNDKGAGFAHDTNKITIIDKYNKVQDFELKNKSEVAKDIVNKVVSLINE